MGSLGGGVDCHCSSSISVSEERELDQAVRVCVHVY